MLVVGADSRRYRAVDRELSPVGRGIRRPWLRLHLQDLESGAVSVVEYRPLTRSRWSGPPRQGRPNPSLQLTRPQSGAGQLSFIVRPQEVSDEHRPWCDRHKRS
jgi:hypothetical protein